MESITIGILLNFGSVIAGVTIVIVTLKNDVKQLKIDRHTMVDEQAAHKLYVERTLTEYQAKNNVRFKSIETDVSSLKKLLFENNK